MLCLFADDKILNIYIFDLSYKNLIRILSVRLLLDSSVESFLGNYAS